MRDRKNKILSPGEKAAHTRKWRNAQAKAQKTARNAKTFTKLTLTKMGWKCASLDAKSGYEYKGVVDMLAVKRDKTDPDKLHMMLLQVKGGSAKVTLEEIRRLNKAVRNISVEWNVAEKPGKKVRFLNKIA